MKKNFEENFSINQDLPMQTLMDAAPMPMAHRIVASGSRLGSIALFPLFDDT